MESPQTSPSGAAAQVLGRLWTRLRGGLAAGTVSRYLDVQGGNWAAAIALNLLLALFPIFLAIIFVASVVTRDPGTRDAVLQQLGRVLPPSAPGDRTSAYEQLRDALDNIRNSTGLLGIVTFLSLLWGGSALFGCIETALGAVYRFRPRDFVPQKLMSFAMIVAFGALTVLGIAASSALALLTPIAERTGGGEFLGGPARYLLQVAAGIAVGLVLFGLIYIVVPRPRQSLRCALPGSLFGAVVFELLTLIWPIYFRVAGQGLSRYGQDFGLLLVLTTYVYFLAQILMLGAVLNAEANHRRQRRGDAPAPARQDAGVPSLQVPASRN